MSEQAHCAFVIQKKKRCCRMLAKVGQRFCGEHAISEEHNQDRIKCPNDPKHTVDRRKLIQHLKRCNSRLLQKKWIVENMNVMQVETTSAKKISEKPSEEEIKKVIDKVNLCYMGIRDEVHKEQFHCKEIEVHLNQQASISNSKRKHLVQQSSIIGHLQSTMLLKNEPSSCIFELGAGKAQLSYWLTKSVPSATFLLIDRSGSRHKYDNKAVQDNPSLNIKRLRCSIEHLDLSEVDILKEVSSICAVSKHFCGSATDAGIRCLSNGIECGLPLNGFLLVPCCHHKSRHSEYCGLDFLKKWSMDSYGDFAALRHIASWAVCGITKMQDNNDDSEIDEVLWTDGNIIGSKDIPMENMNKIANHTVETTTKGQLKPCEGTESSFVPWSPQWKEEMGRRAKMVLEMGRALHLARLGFSTRVVEYVPREISPENLLIIGVKHE